MVRPLLALASLALSTAPTVASVAMPSLFSDHMVLQRDVPLRVWGWAAPGEIVNVHIAKGEPANRIRSARTVTGPDGKWEVSLLPLPAGGPFELQVLGQNSLAFTDVLAGDVWVGSGQSNMEMAVASSKDAQTEIAAANHPDIRLFTVPRRSTEFPMADAYGTWARCSPETVPRFSAAAYFFGRELRQQLGVPIGLIHSSWGGTPAEAWTPRPWLRAHSVLGQRLGAYLEGLKTYPERKAQWDAEMETWRRKPEAERGPQPRAPGGGPGGGGVPGGLYQGMIAPLVKYPVRGVIWYQGESNAGEPELYSELFPMMITAWRQAWNRPELPFYFVQLANFETGFNWAWVREAQAAALRLPHVGLATAIDVGEARDIHPKNKQAVGRRLALIALADAYRRPVQGFGPTYTGFAVEGSAIRVQFAAAQGLNARGGTVTSLEIAGDDRKFVPATGTVDGQTLVVRSAEVPHPVAVRYAWASNPSANLYNGAGLPAPPFRTDAWPRQ
ncbi:MAG: sialate O-acetylesterase [Fimbriimonadaceae bacterium]|nr:sialate O-acetylesterase [Chthonomonadaceae bacterium]MCO5296234.1 sialate O-acetylesterase [Fimbriimonadaceae bacterium]